MKFYFIDHDNFYHGRVFGEIESHAQMHIDNGILTGTVTTLDETYHIEVSIYVLNEFYTIITKAI